LEETAVLQFSALVSAMGWTNEMAFAKVLCSTARLASADDALAVLEPFAVKVAWVVLWGGGGSDARLLTHFVCESPIRTRRLDSSKNLANVS
jgi:hypothetical protein